MSEQHRIPSSVSTYDLDPYIQALPPSRSSTHMGWEGVVARTYRSPAHMESMVLPAVPDVSLVMLTQGAMQFESRYLGENWEGLHARAGDWFLTPGGGAPYELRWHKTSLEDPYILNLHVDSALLGHTAEQLADHLPARIELMDRAGFQDPLLAQMGFALQQELLVPTSVGKLYAQTAAQMIAVHLLRHYLTTNLSITDITDVTHKLSRQQLRQTIEYIVAHLDQDLSLDALAHQLGFSPYHFARLFRATTAESPHQFVVSKRIEVAQQLLKTSDLPLAQVALAAGFPNQSHFSRVFKQRRGLTPAQYRHAHI
jgi:AraC family transcriptional regulator